MAATAAHDLGPCLCLLHRLSGNVFLRVTFALKACVSNPTLPPCLAVQFLRRLAPPNEPYLHNDLQYREVRAVLAAVSGRYGLCLQRFACTAAPIGPAPLECEDAAPASD